MNTYNPQNDSYFTNSEILRNINTQETNNIPENLISTDEKSSSSIFSDQQYKFSNDFDDDEDEIDPNDYYRRQKLYWDIIDL
jgi:replication-associated recombination protein RarA